MLNDSNNPYESPSASSPEAGPPKWSASRNTNWIRAIFFSHLLVITASAYVVVSDTILSNQILELLIALPLHLTSIVFPILMVIAAITSTRQSKFIRGIAVLGDISLSAIQYLIWLPTFQ